MGRLLGLDYGTKRVGVAISDSGQLVATPYAVIDAADPFPALEEILAAEEIDTIVVGLPVSLAGHEGPSAEAARAFGKAVADHTSCEVVFVDERFTTKVAEDALIAGGVRRARRRDIRDKMAATVILQGHLDSLR
jgi:putative Holliday junction resolvase